MYRADAAGTHQGHIRKPARGRPIEARSAGTNGLLNVAVKPAGVGITEVTSKPRVVIAALVPMMGERN